MRKNAAGAPHLHLKKQIPGYTRAAPPSASSCEDQAGIVSYTVHNFTFLNRSALKITDTDDTDIAAPAIIG
ncbi:MAG: hypothetical protein ACREH8_22310, partial [Opitutaceae bacterium]